MFLFAYFLSFFMIFQSCPSASCAKTCTSSCTRISFNVKNGLKDRALEDERKLKNTIVENDSQCFYECSKDCKCLSFNVCGKTCQLNPVNTDRELMAPRKLLHVKVGCRYYDMPKAESACEKTSSGSGICCTQLSHPCFNGGTCDVNTSDVTRRFICKCPSGYYGDQCEIKKPKSCLDYWTGATMKPISRKYMLEDQAGKAYETFCDFDSEEGIAWTLIESFAMNNEATLLRFPFTIDHPLNESNLNWNLYRLSKTTMQDIASRSTFWRGTCSYPIYGIDFRDYVRVRLSALDPTVFIGGVTYASTSCILMDFLDVKGTRCLNCTTTIFQLQNEMLHINLYHGRVHHGCNFDSSSVKYKCENNQYARLMGVYWACSDPSYRCTENPSSTTQFWFGQLKP